jgi:prepilin-type N-terminal cleavage/methylation domain-containing protein
MELTAHRAVRVKIRTLTAGNRGFTLFEILLVLFIIGLAGSVVMFSGSRLQEKTVFNTEARKLYLTLKHARQVSMLERRDIVLRIDRESKRYWLDYGKDKTSEMHSITKKFLIEGDDIMFFPKGNSTGGKIEIVNGKGQKYEINVDPVFGRTSIRRF